MAKAQLYEESPIYTDYELSLTERGMQGLFRKLGLRFPPPVLAYKLQKITDACPVNFGYETGGAKKGTLNLAVHYERWTNIVGHTQLERALQELLLEKFIYQCFKISCVRRSCYFHVQSLPYRPTSFIFTRDFPHAAEIRQYVIEQYPSLCEAVEMDSSYQYKEFYHCHVAFIEVCEAVVGAIRANGTWGSNEHILRQI
ncbi:MAG: hypothetical protein HOC20_04605 [Chloroflexi bacterium]|nr:hypothetical protein [Chloroflexota bacterium]